MAEPRCGFAGSWNAAAAESPAEKERAEQVEEPDEGGYTSAKNSRSLNRGASYLAQLNGCLL